MIGKDTNPTFWKSRVCSGTSFIVLILLAVAMAGGVGLDRVPQK